MLFCLSPLCNFTFLTSTISDRSPSKVINPQFQKYQPIKFKSIPNRVIYHRLVHTSRSRYRTFGSIKNGTVICNVIMRWSGSTYSSNFLDNVNPTSPIEERHLLLVSRPGLVLYPGPDCAPLHYEDIIRSNAILVQSVSVL